MATTQLDGSLAWDIMMHTILVNWYDNQLKKISGTLLLLDDKVKLAFSHLCWQLDNGW